MATAENSTAGESNFRRDADCLCGSIRKAFEQAADAILPPPSARKHFRQARVEVWKGIRELVDLRIAHLSREDTQGTRVVVE